MWTEMIDGRTVHNFFEHIDSWRLEKEQKISTALSVLSGTEFKSNLSFPRNITFSLLQHTLYLAKRAAETNDVDLANDALALWSLDESAFEPFLYNYDNATFLIVNSEYCKRATYNQNFNNNAYCITHDIIKNAKQSLSNDYVEEALKLISATHLLFFNELTGSVIINLDWRDLDDSTDSYTLTPLSGTVFTDWTESPLRYAEAILHESVHSWLNYYLMREEINVINTANSWYSPWRNTMRPALGIVHGTFAFSIVYHFYKRLSEGNGFNLLNDKQLKYCYDRTDYELSRLKQVESSIIPALDEIGSENIKELLTTWYPGVKRFEIYKEG
ncbi:aKG-HExxH-type peptide beta-hydroxylase [Paenibacillus paeoniae]|nr:HEXXH motif-containing putative peptide modification protein [Paenibacillus paeoniae]